MLKLNSKPFQKLIAIAAMSLCCFSCASKPGHGTAEQAEKGRLYANTPMVSPVVGPIVRGYGVYSHRGKKKTNQGVDFRAESGAVVQATADGIVKSASTNAITIDHGGAIETRYRGLSKIKVRKGEAVHRHDHLGVVASPGYLHYEVHAHGLNVDPSRYILDR